MKKFDKLRQKMSTSRRDQNKKISEKWLKKMVDAEDECDAICAGSSMTIGRGCKTKKKNFYALVHKFENSDYGVSFPELPGCVSVGKTLEEARENACEALQMHLETMEEVDDKSFEDDGLVDVFVVEMEKE